MMLQKLNSRCLGLLSNARDLYGGGSGRTVSDRVPPWATLGAHFRDSCRLKHIYSACVNMVNKGWCVCIWRLKTQQPGSWDRIQGDLRFIAAEMRSGSYVGGRQRSRSQTMSHQILRIGSASNSRMFRSRSIRTCSASPTKHKVDFVFSNAEEERVDLPSIRDRRPLSFWTMCGTFCGTSSSSSLARQLPGNAGMYSTDSKTHRTGCRGHSCGSCRHDWTWERWGKSGCTQTFSLDSWGLVPLGPKVEVCFGMKHRADRGLPFAYPDRSMMQRLNSPVATKRCLRYQ